MNSKHNNSMSASLPQLSEKEIKDYHSGHLSSSEKYRIERIAEGDPMSKAALDGMAGGDYSESISSIKKSVAIKSGMRFGLFQKSVLIISTAAVVALLAVWMNSNEEPSQGPISELIIEEQEFIEKTDQAEPSATVDNEFEEKIIIKTERTDSSVSLTISSKIEEIDKPEENYVSYVPADSTVNMKLELINPVSGVDSDTEDSNKEIQQSNKKDSQAIYHIEDYKVIDYRELREEEFTQLKTELGGTPANYANRDEKSNDQNEIEFIQVAYVDYLDDAIVLFSKANFKEANRKFRTILKKYPDDANALFYKGMCEYRLGNYKKSKELLEESSNGAIETFHEESEFYLARSLMMGGHVNQSRIILTAIVEQGGFYAKQAEELLK